MEVRIALLSDGFSRKKSSEDELLCSNDEFKGLCDSLPLRDRLTLFIELLSFVSDVDLTCLLLLVVELFRSRVDARLAAEAAVAPAMIFLILIKYWM